MKRKFTNVLLVIISVVLFIGTVTICFYGEYNNRKSYKSNVNNAKEVRIYYNKNV
jgi:flagellar basal body-associated protein FliL